MNARLRFLADEDFDNDIVRGLLRRLPTLDWYASRIGLSGQLDPVVLAWAAQKCVILTHDREYDDGTRLRAYC